VKIIKQDSEFFEGRLNELISRREKLFDLLAPEVDAIIEKVKTERESALLYYAEDFDGVKLSKEELWIDPDQIKNAHKFLSLELRQAIESAYARVKRFNQELKPSPFQMQDEEGVYWGVEMRPFDRVGFYVPRNYFMSLLVGGVPARLVGVEDLIVSTPPMKSLGAPYVHPAILYVCKLLEINKVLVSGGVSALTAMAVGLEGFPPVEKIVGPTLRQGMLAKLRLSHLVGIDGFMGPSEIAYVGDKTSSVEVVAADVAAIADHNPDAEIMIFHSQEKWMQNLMDALVKRAERVKEREGRDGIRNCLEARTSFFLMDDLDSIFNAVNRLSPAMVCLMLRDAARYLEFLKRCGAVLLGSYCPPSASDLIGGAMGLLPTLGSSVFFNPTGPSQFLRQLRVLEMDAKALKRLRDDSLLISEVEGFSTRKDVFLTRLGHD